MNFKLLLFIAIAYIAYVSAQEQTKFQGGNGKLSREKFEEWSAKFGGAEMLQQYSGIIDQIFKKCQEAGNDTEDVVQKSFKIASCVRQQGQKMFPNMASKF